MKNKNLLVIAHSYPDKDLKYPYGMFVKEQVDVLAQYFDKIFVISPQVFGTRKYLEDYSYGNIHVYFPRLFHAPLEIARKTLGKRFFKAIDKLIRKKNIKFHLIHSHFTWPQGEASVYLKNEYDVPVVLTVHEDRNWFLKEYNSGESRYMDTWKNVDAIIRVNKIDTSLLKKINPSTYAVPNGYNPRKFYPIPREKAKKMLGLRGDKKIVFNLAALRDYKGHEILIKAVSLLSKDTLKDIVFYIGGKGPLYETLKNSISSLSLEDKIKLLGFVPDEQVPLWINAAEFFVLPSLSEGNPTVMFEALGCGTPLVATSVGGVPEVLISEDYGLLCEPGDPEGLAEKIEIAINKNWDRDKILDYAKNFTWDRIVADHIIPIYKKLMS